MSMERRLLVRSTKGMLNPNPKSKRNRLPWEAAATASILSTDMDISAITITLMA